MNKIALKIVVLISVICFQYNSYGQISIFKTIEYPNRISNSGVLKAKDLLFFTVYNQTTKQLDLWKSDGTKSGTTLFKPLCTNQFHYFEILSFDSIIIFAYKSGENTNKEYWITDGTLNGTMKLPLNVSSDESICRIEHFIYAENKLIFGYREELTKTNHISYINIPSLERGYLTTPQFKYDTDAYYPNAKHPFRCYFRIYNEGPAMAYLNGFVFFGGEQWDTNSEPGPEVYRCNIKTGEITLVKNCNTTGFSTPKAFYSCNGKIYFSTDKPNGLWVSDGTPNGTILLKDDNLGALNFSPIGDLCVFEHYTMVEKNEPWITDGTKEGTFLLKDINPTSHSLSGTYFPKNPIFTNYNNQLYFLAEEEYWNGLKLWRTDGTKGNTVKAFSEILNGVFICNDKLYLTEKKTIEYTAKIWSYEITSPEPTLICNLDDISGYGAFGATNNILFLSKTSRDYSKTDLFILGNNEANTLNNGTFEYDIKVLSGENSISVQTNNSILSNATVTVYDLLGATVHKQKIKADNVVLNFAFKPGLYVVRVWLYNNQFKAQKVLVK